MHRRSLLFVLATLAGCQSKPSRDELIVGAATSLRHVLPRIVEAFHKDQPSTNVVVTYGASGDLAAQVDAGAGLDVVVFASKAPVDKLVLARRVDPTSCHAVATNELVLIGPDPGPRLSFQTLDALPANERMAIGDPVSVPVGQYAREALEKLKLWDKLKDRIVFGGNVAAVLAYVQRGEVTAAIVYRTEVEGAKGIQVLDVAKGAWAPKPELWTGVVTESHDRKRATDFVDFLQSPGAQRIFASFGFGPP